MKRLYFAFFLIFIFFSKGVHAQLGEIGVNPLRTEIGARPLGMGGAFTGVADDVNALLYNPGGMAWARGISLTVRDFENITAVQAYPTGYGSSLGLAIVTSKIANIPIPSSFGVATSNSSVLLLSYGTKLNFLPVLYKQEAFQRLGLGINIKGLLGQTLRRSGQPDLSGTGWDLDLGLLWKGADWWATGVAAQNILSTKITWDTGAEEGIPASLKLAGSVRVIGDVGSPIFVEGRELLLAGEIDFNNSAPTLVRLASEWGFKKTFFFRTGVMQQNKLGGVTSTINFGLGYRSGMWGADLVSYREPIRDEILTYFSFLYFPKEWIVVEKLEVEKPAIMLEKAIEKISLEDNIVTYEEKLDVFGKVKSGVEVYVNGFRAATAEDNTFKVVVPLETGKNLILVEARYEGEKKSWKYKVLRKAKVLVAEEKTVKKEFEKAVTVEEKEALKKKEQEVAQSREKVEELVTLGVIEVTPEAEFKLEASVTRGELSAWLAKAAGLRLPRVERDLFTDVKRDHPLAPYIKVVVDWNLLRPFPDGTFRPDAPVTKEEGEQLFKILGIKK